MLDDVFGEAPVGFGGPPPAPGAPSKAASALLAEVGGTIAITASGVLSVRGITSADSNLAALPMRVQQALIRAVKSLTKDVITDLLLSDVRARIDAEARAAAERAATGVSDDEGADEAGLPVRGAAGVSAEAEAAPDTADAAAARSRAATEGSTGGKAAVKRAKESAAQEYQRRRMEMRERPFADLCSSIGADDIPQALMRVAAAFAEVMHSHYLLLQWHRTPLDPRTQYENCEFLHMSALDDTDLSSGAVDARDDEDERVHKAASVKAAASRIPRGTGFASQPALDADHFLTLLQVCVCEDALCELMRNAFDLTPISRYLITEPTIVLFPSCRTFDL
jgi:hypothetical protein